MIPGDSFSVLIGGPVADTGMSLSLGGKYRDASVSGWRGVIALSGATRNHRPRTYRVSTMSDVRLVTYRRCTFSEKRAVLGVFWARRESDNDTVNEAAREYGPYALAMVVVIAVELAVIAAVLLNKDNVWAWPAVAVTGLAVVCVWWTRVCQRTIASSARGPAPS